MTDEQMRTPQMSSDIKELATALCAAQKDIKSVPADTAGVYNKYAKLDACLDAIRESLSKHGLTFTQIPTIDERGNDAINTMLVHTSGQWIMGTMTVRARDNTAQAMGSGITYARRYSIMSMVGVATTTDDDGAEASAPPKSDQASKKEWVPPPKSVAKSKPSVKPVVIPNVIAKDTSSDFADFPDDMPVF